IIVGALLAAAAKGGGGAGDGAVALSRGLGLLAVALASVNIFGGFLVTRRMLAMYKKKEKK
ncbi:MAG: NAD(P) transhydrogenase subunit alpha, partial [Caulobacterales bacterium]|nr:NAD(P) transhydrogenase subunit alpha [Caulobacterales bacterium]